MNMDDKNPKYGYDRMYVTHAVWRKYYETCVYSSLKKSRGLIGKLCVSNLALTGLSTTAFIFLQNIVRYIL